MRLIIQVHKAFAGGVDSDDRVHLCQGIQAPGPHGKEILDSPGRLHRMDHLLFMQFHDCGVLGFLVKDAKEQNTRTGKYACNNDK